jgi:two-component system LytT family response regulator
VLKPVMRERLAKTLQRLKPQLQVAEKDTTLEPAVVIRCFSSLQVEYKEQTVEQLKWRTTKGQELFAYLVHYRGQSVRKSVLLDTLWPGVDQKKAIALMYTTIYQIRKSLKRHGIDISIHSLSVEEGYMLDAGRVKLESDEWERSLRMLKDVNPSELEEHQRVLDMYRGEYLGDHDYIWAENERQRLRMLWLQHARQVAEVYSQNGMFNEAVVVYQRIQREDPLLEESFFGLMKLYDLLGQRVAVEEQYQRLVKMLEQELNVGPQEQISRWYEMWRQRPQLAGDPGGLRILNRRKG